MDKKAISVKISEGGGEVKYIESSDDTTQGKFRKNRTAEEFVRFQELSEDSWSKRFNYLLCCILIGNGTDMFPAMMRLSLQLSGGALILMVLFFSIIFGLPLLYMETFLGRYTRLTNCQMYRMTPIFFGLCAMIFIFNVIYECMTATEQTQVLVSFLKLMVNPNLNMKCLDDSAECYDYKIRGPINDNCKYGYISMICEKHGEIRYPMQYYYWKMYRDPHSNIFPMWQSIIAVVITWGCILVIVTKKISAIGSIVNIAFIVQILTLTGLFISTLTDSGSVLGLQVLITANLKGLDLYEVLTVGWYSLCRLGLIVPTGFMTFSAYAPFKSKLATECTIIVLFSVALSFYYLTVFFSIAGVLADAMKVSVESVIVPYRGLYLAMIPELLVYLEIPNVVLLIYYSSLWFFEVAKLALYVHMLILNLYDYFPTFKTFASYIWVTSCVIFCLICMIMCTRSAFTVGMPALWLLYVTLGIVVAISLETTMVSYFYGVIRLFDDIYFMYGQKPITFWVVMWYSIPIVGWVSVFLIIFKHRDTTLEADYLKGIHGESAWFYSTITFWVLICGGMLFSIMYIIFRFGTPDLMISLLKPQYFWGPPEKTHRMNRKNFYPRFIIRSQQIFQNTNAEASIEHRHTELLSDLSKEVIKDRFIYEGMREDNFFRKIGLFSEITVPSDYKNAQQRDAEVEQRDVTM